MISLFTLGNIQTIFIISLKNVYNNSCVYCELKIEKSPAHISYRCMASLQCEYGCDAANDQLS